MNSGGRVDNSRPDLACRSQSSSNSRRRKRRLQKNKYSKFRSLNECDTRYSTRDVDGRPRRVCKLEDRVNAMKEWRIWRALSCIFGWLFRSKEDALKDVELKVLQRFTSTSCWSQFIPISNHVEIRTLKFDLGFSKNCPAIVLLHGFASGLGVWSPCFDYLCQRCPVYALDLPGFGRSTRVPFLGNRNDIEYQYVCYIDEWRDAVGLENFILVGHGFGGYIATLYALRYPERTKHLVLVEPWGFTELPFGIVRKTRGTNTTKEEPPYENRLPWIMKRANDVLNFFHPLYIIKRLPSLLGRWFISKILCGSEGQPVSYTASRNDSSGFNRDDTTRNQGLRSTKELRFTSKNFLWGYDQSYHYMHLSNLLRPTGIHAFGKLNLFYFWSISPLIHRIQNMDPEVPISFIYGGASAVDHKTGYEVYHLLPESFVEVYMLQDAGHNTFIDSPQKFCDILFTIVDNHKNRSRTLSVSSEAGTYDYDDLYWDCAWETLNLSRQNLYFPEDEEELSGNEGLDEDWEFDSYEFSCEEAPEKRYFLAPQISGLDSLRSDGTETGLQDLGSQGFYSYQSNEEEESEMACTG